MRAVNSRRGIFFLLIVLSVFGFCGCKNAGLVGNTYVEPEITVEYLTSEFSAQLVRDGADKQFGIIKNIVDNSNGSYMLTIDLKQFVSDASQPNGFYIADRNLTEDLYLGTNARAVFYPGGDSTKAICSENAKAFIDSLLDDRSVFSPNNSEYENNQLFYFYVMHNEIVLIIQQYMP